MNIEIGALQFLRPAWLAGLLLVPLCGAGWWQLRQRRNPWLRNVDAHLLPGLLEQGTRGLRWIGPAAVMLATALAVVALAGPSWRTAPQPLQAGGTPLVVAWQLSDSTRAGDLPPSRLLQARARIAGMLRARGDSGVALVAYADDAFVVAPLTDDPANIVLFLDALSPDVMPKEGDRPDRAIDLAAELLRRAGVQGGDILLVADGAGGGQAVAAAGRAAASGMRVSTLGMGRAGGALFRRGDGGLAQARFDPASLQAIAAAGGGTYRAWDAPAGESLPGVSSGRGRDPQATLRGGARVPLDGGYWLLLPLLVLVLLVFRRGAGMAVLVACLVVPWQPASAQAGADGTAWRRPDQVAHARDREAESAYRRGAFADAARAWAQAEGADSDYNRGNALARAGRYEDAIAAYDEALRARPGMADAAANRAAVQAALQRRPPPGPRDGSRGNQDTGSDQSGRPRDRPDGATDGGASSGEDRPEGDGQPGGAAPPRAPASPPAAGKAGSGGARDPMAAAADPERQRQADAAQRAAMDAALGRAEEGSAGTPGDVDAPVGTAAERERRQASEAWLQRIPDDPGGLLRTRFRLEHERRQRAGRDELP